MRLSAPSPVRRAAAPICAAVLVGAAFTASSGAASAQPVTDYLYVANNLSNTVTVINGSTFTFVTSIPVGDSPWAEAATPDNSQVYVSDDSGVQVIDTATNTVTATIPSPGGATDIAISPDGTRAYSVNRGSGTVSVIDTATEQVVATVIIPRVGNVPVSVPWGVAVSPDGKRAYVTSTRGSLNVINTATDKIIKTISVGAYASGIAVSPDGSKLYLVDASPDAQGELSVLNSSTGKAIAQIVVSPNPVDVTLSPNGKIAYVVDDTVNMVSEINTSKETLTATVELPASSIAWSVAATATQAFIPDYSTDEVEEVIPGEAQSFGFAASGGDGPTAIAIAALS